jgi:type IV secretory pathway TraG/TraD family ATPase VirD4
VTSSEFTKTLISTTAFKIVFTQLAQETMKEISDLIGNKTTNKLRQQFKFSYFEQVKLNKKIGVKK